MSSIPEDVYLQILLRVPVKSTFVCKCVCKNWLNLISNPDFVKMHLDFNVQNNNYSLMLNGVDENNSQIYQLHSISFDSLSSVASIDEFQDCVIKMDYPFKVAVHNAALKCSCDGLLCLGFYDGFSRNLSLWIWNPATGEYKKLPSPPREDPNDSTYSCLLDYFAIYALGYDYNINDYKLVRVVNMKKGNNSSICIYRLGSNSWKYIQTIPYKIHVYRWSWKIVSGVLYWLARTITNTNAIVSFGISDERFEELQLPEELLDTKELFISIGEWEDCLCLLVNAHNLWYHVWVMQEDGVHKSWAKRFSITLKSVDSFQWLMWSFMNGKILLKTSRDLVLYDPKNASPRETYIHRPMLVGELENYVESLVSLNSGTYFSR